MAAVDPSARRAPASGSEASHRSLLPSLLRPFEEFVAAGSAGGLLLMACTVIALAWANSPWAWSYQRLWHTTITVGPEAHPLSLMLEHWINDGLMAVFFLLVGLEIKRELLVGELASLRNATLPIAAAIGGMVLPAALYALLNASGPGAAGWGIPMATDIAFALAVLMLAGPGVPVGLKVFLTALAIVDDVGAVLVIAFFYTASVHLTALAVAAAMALVLLALNRRGVQSLLPYLVVGAALWLAMHESGVHATIAGILLALAIPATSSADTGEFSARTRELLDRFDAGETGDSLLITSAAQQKALHELEAAAIAVAPPLLRLEHALHGVVGNGIMPLFALANAGVSVDRLGDAARNPVAVGIVVGLLAGKVGGILGASWLAVRSGVATLPAGVGWKGIHGAAWLAGIGFTMSMFVAMLAFEDASQTDVAKVAILFASTTAGAVGWMLLRRAYPAT